MDGESGSRALGAAHDLWQLLRLAQSAAERVTQEVFGPAYERAELLARDLHRLRRSAEALRQEVENHVSREEHASVARGHPLRRTSDAIRGRSPNSGDA